MVKKNRIAFFDASALRPGPLYTLFSFLNILLSFPSKKKKKKKDHAQVLSNFSSSTFQLTSKDLSTNMRSIFKIINPKHKSQMQIKSI